MRIQHLHIGRVGGRVVCNGLTLGGCGSWGGNERATGSHRSWMAMRCCVIVQNDHKYHWVTEPTRHQTSTHACLARLPTPNSSLLCANIRRCRALRHHPLWICTLRCEAQRDTIETRTPPHPARLTHEDDEEAFALLGVLRLGHENRLTAVPGLPEVLPAEQVKIETRGPETDMGRRLKGGKKAATSSRAKCNNRKTNADPRRVHPGKMERIFNTAVTVVTHVCRPRSPFRTLEVAPLDRLREWGFPVASAEASAAITTEHTQTACTRQDGRHLVQDVGARLAATRHFVRELGFEGDGRSRGVFFGRYYHVHAYYNAREHLAQVDIFLKPGRVYGTEAGVPSFAALPASRDQSKLEVATSTSKSTENAHPPLASYSQTLRRSSQLLSGRATEKYVH